MGHSIAFVVFNIPEVWRLQCRRQLQPHLIIHIIVPRLWFVTLSAPQQVPSLCSPDLGYRTKNHIFGWAQQYFSLKVFFSVWVCLRWRKCCPTPTARVPAYTCSWVCNRGKQHFPGRYRRIVFKTLSFLFVDPSGFRGTWFSSAVPLSPRKAWRNWISFTLTNLFLWADAVSKQGGSGTWKPSVGTRWRGGEGCVREFSIRECAFSLKCLPHVAGLGGGCGLNGVLSKFVGWSSSP